MSYTLASPAKYSPYPQKNPSQRHQRSRSLFSSCPSTTRLRKPPRHDLVKGVHQQKKGADTPTRKRPMRSHLIVRVEVPSDPDIFSRLGPRSGGVLNRLGPRVPATTSLTANEQGRPARAVTRRMVSFSRRSEATSPAAVEVLQYHTASPSPTSRTGDLPFKARRHHEKACCNRPSSAARMLGKTVQTGVARDPPRILGVTHTISGAFPDQPTSLKRKRSDEYHGRPTTRGNDRPPTKSGASSLNTSRAEVLRWIQKNGNNIQYPKPMIGGRRDPNKRCLFHNDIGHDTEDCYQLKREIEALIQSGFLKKFVRKQGQAAEPRKAESETSEATKECYRIAARNETVPATSGNVCK